MNMKLSLFVILFILCIMCIIMIISNQWVSGEKLTTVAKADVSAFSDNDATTVAEEDGTEISEFDVESAVKDGAKAYKLTPFSLNNRNDSHMKTFSTLDEALENCMVILLFNIDQAIDEFELYMCTGYSDYNSDCLTSAHYACVQQNEQGQFSCRTELPIDYYDMPFNSCYNF
ncbi:uncharacterized protein LOC122501074 [Leptopilina heterotoma]|uniref:uncharacterized protein LOC122501074 n=1 Tax=Leptopilina heterotoma TaxID=63436 RepID=UPI001CA9BD57|nr:uncharacterized protein LOC122501074 [Leptopilina heterotoma]